MSGDHFSPDPASSCLRVLKQTLVVSSRGRHVLSGESMNAALIPSVVVFPQRQSRETSSRGEGTNVD